MKFRIYVFTIKIQEKLLQEPDMGMTREQKIDRQNLEEVEEEVFKNAYIPRTMVEILDAERDAFKVPECDEDEVNCLTFHRN